MKKRPFHQEIGFITSMFMALVYIGGGIYLIASSLSFRFLPAGSAARYIFAVALIAYGIYRGYRAREFRQE